MDAQRAEEEADKAIAALQVLPDTLGEKHSSASRTSLFNAIVNPSPHPAQRAG